MSISVLHFFGLILLLSLSLALVVASNHHHAVDLLNETYKPSVGILCITQISCDILLLISLYSKGFENTPK